MYTSKLPYSKLYKPLILRIFIGILSFIFSIITAELSSNFIRHAMDKKTNDTFIQAIFFIMFIVLSQVVLFGFERYQNRIEKIHSHKFRMRIYRIFLNQSISDINKLSIGDIKERITRDLENVITLFTTNIPYIIIGVVTSIGYLIYISFLNPLIALTLFIISFTQLIPPYIVKKILVKNYGEAAKVGKEWMEHVIAGCKGLSTIKMNNLKSWYIKRFMIINNKNVEVYKNNFQTYGQETALSNMVNSFLSYGTYAVIGIFVFKGLIKMDSAIKIVVLCGSFYKSTDGMYKSLPQVFIAKKAINRLLNFNNNNSLIITEFKESKNIFELKDVSFGYDNNVILKKVNLQIPKGTSTAIVGKNGVGKSTLIKLLLGMENNYTGDIKFNGSDIRTLSDEQLYSNIAYISQSDAEFNISPINLFEMISDSESIDINKIKKLGLDLGLSNDNFSANSLVELSGGEQKKVCLAIGIIRKASLLILDEPTNSLDMQSQEQLIKILLSLNKTLIIISHDEKLISNCHYILRFDKNNILFSLNNSRTGGDLYA